MTKEDNDDSELTQDKIEQIIEQKINKKSVQEELSPFEQKIAQLIEQKIEEIIEQKIENQANLDEDIEQLKKQTIKDRKEQQQEQDSLEETKNQLKQNQVFTRRSFLKTLGLGTLGLGAATALNPVKALNIRDNDGLNVHASGTHKLEIPGSGAVQIKNTDLYVPDGKVGIGNTNPANDLHVAGNTGIRLPVGDNEQRNSSPVEGETRLNSEEEQLETYYEGGWRVIRNIGQPIDAEGGSTVIDRTLDGREYRIHAFEITGNHEFIVNDLGRNDEIDFLVVAGGGGGGGHSGENNPGGGGAGGAVYVENYRVSVERYHISVGEGGEGVSSGGSGDVGERGGDSEFEDITAVGGGGGANQNASGGDGGCGGGMRDRDDDYELGSSIQEDQGVGTAYGHRGRKTLELENADENAGGGGGGIGGLPPTETDGYRHGGHGGPGLDFSNQFSTTFGEDGWFGGGGAGAGDNGDGDGGIGGGGDGKSDGSPGESGMPNTGGGGGAADINSDTGGDGGSGIVLIRYPI